MEENKAKTTEEQKTLGDGANADTVASEVTKTEKEGVTVTSTDKTPSPVEERDVNRENARRRREAERMAALGEARERAIIETLNGKNPYDGSEMKDAGDVERFLKMKEEYLEKEARKDREEREREEWLLRDSEAFQKAYPDLDTETLFEDARFQGFAHGKLGHLPMKEIYEGYCEFLSAFDERTKSIAAQTLANSAAGHGSLGGSGTARSDSYTAEEVRRMSPREVKENYEKIRNSMMKW